MTNERDDPAGTANKLRQAKPYNELSEEYTPEGANLIASRSLDRNGVPATPEIVSNWAMVNRAAEIGQMDLAAERAILNGKTNALIDAILGRPSGDTSVNAEGISLAQIDDEQGLDEEEEDLFEGEGPDHGFEREEDNDEARMDDIRKIQENSGD